MGNKFKTSLVGLLLFIQFGCGYFEADKTDLEIKIDGKLTLFKSELEQLPCIGCKTKDGYVVLLNHCLEIYYNRSESKVYIKQFINPHIIDYKIIEKRKYYSELCTHIVSEESIDSLKYSRSIKGLRCVYKFDGSIKSIR